MHRAALRTRVDETAPPRLLPRAARVSLAAAGALLILGNGLCAGGAILAGQGMTGLPDAGVGALIFGMMALLLAALATLVALAIGIVKGTLGARPSLLVMGSLGLDGVALLLLPRLDNGYVAAALWILAVMLAVTALGALRPDGARV